MPTPIDPAASELAGGDGSAPMTPRRQPWGIHPMAPAPKEGQIPNMIPRFDGDAGVHATTPVGSGDRSLDVAIIYEDLATGLRAKELCNRLQGELGMTVGVGGGIWRIDLLDEPSFRAQAARQAGIAALLMFSCHGSVPLPEFVNDWLRQWQQHRRNRAVAMAVLLDQATREHPTSVPPMLAELRRLARDAKLSLFERFYPAANVGAWWASRAIGQRASASSSVLDGILEQTSHWTPPWVHGPANSGHS